MEIEKIFKNLILADFIVIILMVISSMYQPSEIANLYENLNDGLLSNFENFSRILSIQCSKDNFQTLIYFSIDLKNLIVIF